MSFRITHSIQLTDLSIFYFNPIFKLLPPFDNLYLISIAKFQNDNLSFHS